MLVSEFQHVLHTNYAPTEAEAQKIRDFCVAPEVEVAKLETEVMRLETALAAARRRQDEINGVVAAHRALLSPIRRLSIELLQNVFAFCLAEFPAMHASEAPLLLGCVCKGWREIVYSTAELWSAAHAVLPSAVGSQNQRSLRLEALNKWLSRSGNHPLHISLYDMTSETDGSDVLNLIIPISPRWERIVLTVTPTWFQSLECSFSGISALPLLRFFELRDRAVDGNEFSSEIFIPSFHPFETPDYNPLHLLSLCSNVQRLLVHCSRSRRALLPQSSIGPSLREFDVCCPEIFDSSLGRFLSFLVPCQNLRRLRICASFEISASPSLSVPLIILPALECLIADMASSSPEAQAHNLTFLNHLVAPYLRHLELKSIYDVKELAPTLHNFLTRSSCSLRTLSLNLTDYTHNQGMQPLLLALESANDVKELTIHRWDYNEAQDGEPDRFLLGLAYTNGSINYCPKMTHFTLSTQCDNPDLGSLLIFLQSRLDPPPGCVALQVADLTKIFLGTHFHPTHVFPPVDLHTESFLDSVSKLQGQGLSVLLPQQPVGAFPPTVLTPWTGVPRRRSNSLHSW